MLLLHLPFIMGWVTWMWGRDHYQFFPIILAGFGWLVWERLPLIKWPTAAAFSVRAGIYLLLSALVFAVACWTGSHWVGMIALLCSLWSTVWYVGGSSAADQLRGPFVFLLLLIPLPLNLDLQLIIGLQKIATWLASGALDLRGVRHTVSGVAIRTASKSYMVEEACSGIHSLFSATSVMVFLSVYFRYSLPRLVLSLLQTVFWVLVANAVRVFLIVYVDARWQVSLDSGWRHDALGFATYAGVLLAAISSDQFIRFIFPLSGSGKKVLQKDFFEQVVKPFNKFVSSILDEPKLRGPLAVILPAVVLVALYVPGAGMAVARQWRSAPAGDGEAGGAVVSVAALPQLSGESLPTGLNGWQQLGFEAVTREGNDIFGMSSSVWTYQGDGLTANISADGFYPEWHDLAYCYTASGWKLQSGENHNIRVAGDAVTYTRLNIYKQSGEFAKVYFCCFDSTNTAVKPPDPSGSLWRNLKNRLASGGLGAGDAVSVVPPVYQIQLMVVSDHELLPHEQQSLENLFEASCGKIVPQIEVAQ